MTVHIYNPSHDEALAINRAHYCPSSAARRTAAAFWDVAKHWAAPGDCILRLPDDGSLRGAAFWRVGGDSLREDADSLRDDAESSREGAESLREDVAVPQDASAFDWSAVTAIEPWGWDRHIVGVLRRLGAPEWLLPSEAALAAVRMLSSRQTAVRALEALRREPLPDFVLAADSRWCTTEADVLAAVNAYGHRAMLKQPWSCSGRGVWRSDAPSSEDRVRKTLREQGGVEVEPLYDRVADFAMEFFADGDGGSVRYEGLSLFETHDGGGYAGNVVAPQAELAARLASQVDYPLPLAPLAERLCSVLRAVLFGVYTGPLGVDMMLTPQGVHPCIEVNVRNTMGRVAIFEQRRSGLACGIATPR